MENKFIVRFRENGTWYNITEKSVLKEEADKLYNQHTYYEQLYTEPNEKIYFQVKEITSYEND